MNRTIAFTIMGIFVFLVLFGMYAEMTEEPPPPVKWIDDPKIKRSTLGTTPYSEENNSYQTTTTYKSTYNYEIDDLDTWNDFLEEIDNRGLEYTDPDAVELWELEYK